MKAPPSPCPCCRQIGVSNNAQRNRKILDKVSLFEAHGYSKGINLLKNFSLRRNYFKTVYLKAPYVPTDKSGGFTEILGKTRPWLPKSSKIGHVP